MVESMRGHAVETVTLDRGREFAEHAPFSEAVGAECQVTYNFLRTLTAE